MDEISCVTPLIATPDKKMQYLGNKGSSDKKHGN